MALRSPTPIALLTIPWLLISNLHLAAAEPVELTTVGDWRIRVRLPRTPAAIETTLDVPPAAVVIVSDELYEKVPVFNPKAGGWLKGVQLRGVRAQETTTPFLLDPDSLVLRTSLAADSFAPVAGIHYEADLDWGTFGRKSASSFPEDRAVYASYRYTPLRLDAVVLTAEGPIVLRPGEPRSAAPQVPPLSNGDRLLATVWIPGRIKRLAPQHLFPVLESTYPEAPRATPTPAEVRLPKTLERLRSGQSLRILAWGDSVTDGSYLPNFPRDRWQDQFLARLRAAFPAARIELVTEAWGGRNTSSYLGEPLGSLHNYAEKVLGSKPDLIVSEFVNDAGLDPEQVERRYSKLLADFQGIGAEWIVLTPHYVRPDWMGLDREREIDEDPRPYVHGLRQFAERHDVALADASRRYGRLWRQGIPYTALMLNSINHPDARGMALFADALLELFPAPGGSPKPGNR